MINPPIQKIIFFVLLLFCLTPFVDAPIALILGFLMTLTIGNPFAVQSSKSVKWLLKVAIVGLGFGMNFHSAVHAGKTGLLFTVGTIIFVMLTGWFFGKLLKIETNTSYLIASGTAICGGSAISAIAPIIDADEKQISVALGTVFILNSLALLLFPAVGHLLNLTQHQFGLWCAIAIHDTSSVVGAASKYGKEALEVATTIKLGRALWIIPLSIFTIVFKKSDKTSKKKISIPYFIVLFIVAMLISTFTPQFEPLYTGIVFVSKKALVVTLFLIGAGLSWDVIKSVGAKTFLQGVILWVLISVLALEVILHL